MNAERLPHVGDRILMHADAPYELGGCKAIILCVDMSEGTPYRILVTTPGHYHDEEWSVAGHHFTVVEHARFVTKVSLTDDFVRDLSQELSRTIAGQILQAIQGARPQQPTSGDIGSTHFGRFLT